jgi:hypothetical protein
MCAWLALVVFIIRGFTRGGREYADERRLELLSRGFCEAMRSDSPEELGLQLLKPSGQSRRKDPASARQETGPLPTTHEQSRAETWVVLLETGVPAGRSQGYQKNLEVGRPTLLAFSTWTKMKPVIADPTENNADAQSVTTTSPAGSDAIKPRKRPKSACMQLNALNKRAVPPSAWRSAGAASQSTNRCSFHVKEQTNYQSDSSRHKDGNETGKFPTDTV